MEQTAAETLAAIAALGGDAVNLWVQTDDLQRRCREGMLQEKVSIKDGVLPVVERYPSIELRCLQFKQKLLADLKAEASGTAAETALTVTIVEAVPAEDNL